MSDTYKRYTAVAVYDDNTKKLYQFVIPNNGLHWKKVLAQTDFFFGDELEWLSDTLSEATQQLKSNNRILLSIVNYDKINPLTTRRQLDNGKLD